nr:MAG TPA: hypothetical protein [Caudoviricetes sp.]
MENIRCSFFLPGPQKRSRLFHFQGRNEFGK